MVQRVVHAARAAEQRPIVVVHTSEQIGRGEQLSMRGGTSSMLAAAMTWKEFGGTDSHRLRFN